jgi:hypothetical protein
MTDLSRPNKSERNQLAELSSSSPVNVLTRMMLYIVGNGRLLPGYRRERCAEWRAANDLNDVCGLVLPCDRKYALQFCILVLNDGGVSLIQQPTCPADIYSVPARDLRAE